MLTFYSAVGSYQIRNDDGVKMPYIQKLGKLYPVSIPEFVIWSSLLWEVMNYDELAKVYNEQMKSAGMKAPKLDDMLNLLQRRRLILCGNGYTGIDALYNMLADAFVIPYHIPKCRKILSILKFWTKHLVSLPDAFDRMRTDSIMDGSESRVISLVEQTPLSTAELIRCFERGISDVSTPEKVIAGIYPEDEATQARIAAEQYGSTQKQLVLQAVANLYLSRQIILEVA